MSSGLDLSNLQSKESSKFWIFGKAPHSAAAARDLIVFPAEIMFG